LNNNELKIKNEITKLFEEAGLIKEEMVEITRKAQSEQWTMTKWTEERKGLDNRMAEIDSRLKFLRGKLENF